MNKRIDSLIPKAIEAVKNIQDEMKGKKLPSEYKGYVSSFGAAVLQSGLKAAIAFYESKSSSSVQNKKPLMLAILELVTDKKPDKNNDSLLEYVIKNDSLELKDEILDAAAALKLAINTFEMKGDSKK